jgi:hypothetical protein
MSGAFCDGCGEGNLVADRGGAGKSPVKCDLCGWAADLEELPRKWFDDDGPPWTKRQRKAEGRLFFLWIDFVPDAGDAIYDVMHVLEITSMSGGEQVLVELESKPSEATLEKLRGVRGVTRVWLAP